jgi:hypothetical protein
MDTTRWESYVEFEAQAMPNQMDLARLGDYIGGMPGVETVTPSGVNRGTGYAVAATIVAVATDAGSALNAAIDVFLTACTSETITHSFFREGIVSPADLDPR